MTKSQWIVHKFGGTSVANADRYRGVAEILKSEAPGRKAVVVSAMSKVTDALIELVDLAKSRNPVYLERLEVLKKKHLEVAELLLPEPVRAGIEKVFNSDFEDIREVLRGVWLVQTSSDRTGELVSGYGEIWSAQLLCAFLNQHQGGVTTCWLDARKVLVVEPGDSTVVVDFQASQPKLDRWLEENPSQWVIVTGFIASTPEGIPTTLKRNGSDFSASIFGALLNASSITIWTDVDGVLSADPRLVPEAVVLDELSYAEATELAYFGAKVVHPSTMAPAIGKEIPIWIRNTFNPTYRGTKIHVAPPAQTGEQKSGEIDSRDAVKGFATIDRVALINVEGTGMIGVPGVAQRLFGSLKDVGVSVVMISQASSEHSICFAIPSSQAKLAKATVERAFFAELHHGQIQTVDVKDGCSILAAVGDKMVDCRGVAGKFMSALGRAGVNIRAIAQGSSERNISAVIDHADATRALRAVHAGFYLSNHTLSIGVIGTGLIGGTFLSQLAQAAERLKKDFKIDLRVRALMNSKTMVLDPGQIDLAHWKKTLGGEKAEAVNLERFASHVHAEHLPHAVMVDCTSSQEITGEYLKWLGRGIHIITPNKKANTGSMEFYRALRSACRSGQRHYLYETTVGAGLPVINTLRDLVQTGDEVLQIDGVFSGTLSYIFNSFDGSRPFSDIVKEAKAKGYTEPDPRDDLSGMDVARKLVILAREMGMDLELKDVQVETLVPKGLESKSAEQFMAALSNHDQAMTGLLTESKKKGEVLRYVGVIQKEGSSSKRSAKVALRSYAESHPFARIRGSDNIVAFQTARYHSQPLIVQGPGAGPEVTAGGVFADLLRLSAYLGASL